MAEIVNLRTARKARDRELSAVAADANRAVHGRTLAERQRDTRDADRQRRHLDGAKRDDPDA